MPTIGARPGCHARKVTKCLSWRPLAVWLQPKSVNVSKLLFPNITLCVTGKRDGAAELCVGQKIESEIRLQFYHTRAYILTFCVSQGYIPWSSEQAEVAYAATSALSGLN